MKRWLRIIAVLVSVLLLAAQVVVAAGSKEGSKAYLVGFKAGESAKGLAIAGVKVKKEWAALGAALVEVDEAGLARLRAHGAVEYVEEDRPVSKLAALTDQPITWGLQAVRAEEAWNLGYRGQGIKLCVLDTGIDSSHPEFYRDGVSIIRGGKNFVGDRPSTDFTDGDGHGTHVAGTIAAQGFSSEVPDLEPVPGDGSGIGAPVGIEGPDVVGVAPEVELYIARVLGDDGSGTTAGVIDGLNWCLNEAGTQIASLSLGSSRSSRTEQRAFDNAYSKGMLSIAASGNDGSAKIGYPAAYASVVAVGAVDINLALASFSNYGKHQEVVGPGVAVLSSVPVNTGQMGTAQEGSTSHFALPLAFSGTGSVTSVPLVGCGLASTANPCAGAPASGAWIALIDRGSITFAEKVTNVMAQGAAAAIIANNDTAHPDDAGSFTLGEAGAWIPVVSVSYNSGLAIKADGLGAGSVSAGPSSYAYYDGTSMATPHVSAAAALAWSANPSLSNAQIRSILQSTALDLGKRGKDTTFGYGLVQADQAVLQALFTN